MMKNKTGLVALIVLAAATLLMVFFVLPNMDRDKPAETPVAAGTEATAEEAGGTRTADGKQGRAAGTGENAATPATGEGQAASAAAGTDEETSAAVAGEAAQAGTVEGDPAADWTAPAFDVLRVEPDGSTVIAGRAEPNTTLEIKDGDTVVATTEVGPSGDFAAVFEEPLAAGDYQLTLNTKDETGASKASEEVATISVPKDSGGELLAMVSKPGEASRLITVPEAEEKPAAGAGEAAESPLDQPAAESAAAGAVATDGEAGDAAGAGTGGEAASVPAEEPASDAAAATGDAAAETVETANVPAAGEDAAAAVADPASDAAATGEGAAQAARPQVRVAAVELEGNRMFIAGNARPGALVRIYANETLVGEMKADEEGRYVVDGTIDLPVGRHIIRADVMSEDGSRVEFRASVPFDRPEGEQVAVVARDDAAAEVASAAGLVSDGTLDRLKAEAEKALALLRGLYAGGKLPSAEELAAARSATEFALQSLAEFRPAAEESEAARALAARASAVAAEALSRLQALPQDAADVGAELGSIEAAVKEALASAGEAADGATAADGTPAAADGAAGTTETRPETADTAGGEAATEGGEDTVGTGPAAGSEAATAGSMQGETGSGTAAGAETANETGTAAGSQAGTATGSEAGTAAEAGGEPETVEQAPLQHSSTSVIIRRGDTLWQISRRIYGKGVRYTTIYLANQEQISNPDRIIPGQVFGVPDAATESDSEAEELHRRRLRGG